jgi:hypothetical protein
VTELDITAEVVVDSFWVFFLAELHAKIINANAANKKIFMMNLLFGDKYTRT